MVMWDIVLLIVGIIALLESLIILFFPHWSINLGKKAFKNQKTLKKIAITELIIAIILLLIGMNL